MKRRPWSSWYCVDWYRPSKELLIGKAGWMSGSGNPRGMCYPTRADARVAAADMAAEQQVRTRIRRVAPYCACWIGAVLVDEIGRSRW